MASAPRGERQDRIGDAPAIKSAASAPSTARNAARYDAGAQDLGELLARRRQRQADARQADHLAARRRAARLRRHGDGGGARGGDDRRPQVVVALGGEAHRRRVGIGEQRGQARQRRRRRRAERRQRQAQDLVAARVVDAGEHHVVLAEGAARRQIAQRRVAGVGAELGLRRQRGEERGGAARAILLDELELQAIEDGAGDRGGDQRRAPTATRRRGCESGVAAAACRRRGAMVRLPALIRCAPPCAPARRGRRRGGARPARSP